MVKSIQRAQRQHQQIQVDGTLESRRVVDDGLQGSAEGSRRAPSTAEGGGGGGGGSRLIRGGVGIVYALVLFVALY